MNALAIMPVKDEADILPWSIRHLQDQGLKVHVIDNWSTDGSWEMLRGRGVSGERWPRGGPDTLYQCKAMLDRVDEVAASSSADWCMFNDADEIRRSSRDESLLAGFERVESEGFNAINFKLYYFRPIDNGYSGDPEKYFQHYALNHCDCRLQHVKAWRNTGQRVNLSAHGSHRLEFDGLKVYLESWMLKHYPIRSQAHGERKMRERLVRFDPAEQARGWHVQYRGMEAPGHNFLADPSTLQRWPT
jgi:glycosyltransferase involved in cell wall biosynthesis